MKTPITYYGGKQGLLAVLLPLIPPHTIYVEPFAGGAAVFWAKQPAPVEVLNDTNKSLMNFYRVLKLNYPGLNKEIQSTLHSRTLHDDAKIIYKYPHLFTPIKCAWAVWILANQSYLAVLGGGWAYSTNHRQTNAVNTKRHLFSKELAERLEHVQIECTDALNVIQTRDSRDTFFFIDPPYFNSDMGRYKGYTEQDFANLLDALSQIKGKFLLISYQSNTLRKSVKQNGWQTQTVRRKMGAKRVLKEKHEVLTTNYTIT